MSGPEVYQLSLGPLTGVAFGPDRSGEQLGRGPHGLSSQPVEVAISPNNNDTQVYKKGGDGWDLQQTLSEVTTPL